MKYLALTLSTLALALLTLVAVVMWQTIGTPRRTALPVQASMRPLDERQLREQEELRSAIAELMPLAQRSGAGAFAPATDGADTGTASAATQNTMGGQIFALTAQTPQSRQRETRHITVARTPAAPLPLPRVNVVVEGNSGVKAMVNGRLVSVGDHIEGGMVIKSIDIDAVTFLSGKEELEIKMPLERLRVLGAFPPLPRVD